MDDSLRAETRHSLRALDWSPPAGGLQATAGTRAVEEALAARKPLLWIEGACGSGLTTATAAALRSSDVFDGVKRIACYPCMRVEELLYLASDFFRQLGVDDLERVLDQRSPLQAKLGVLLDALSRRPLVLWIDGLDRLESGDGREDGGAELLALLSACASLSAGAPGRLIFTAACGPPPAAPLEHLLRLELPCLSPEEAEAIWQGLGRGSGEVVEMEVGELPPALRGSPFALELLHALGRREGRDAAAPLAASAGELGRLLDLLLQRLSADSLALLEVAAAFRRPLSRQALRELSAVDGRAVLLEADRLDLRLEELEARRLVQLARSGEGPGFCALPAAVQRAVESSTRKHRRERWNELLAAAGGYLLHSTPRTASFWVFHHARRHYFDAGRHLEAYQLHKCFLEDVLRFGYLDLARRVLLETVATTTGPLRAVTLGNLAITYKNEADYDRALEIYQRVKAELEELGDQANLARVLHQIGNTRYLKGDAGGALESYQQSLALSTDLGDKTIIAATEVQIANLLYHLGRLDEALRTYERSLEHLRATANGGLIAAVKLQTGHLHYQAKRYFEAEAHFREAESGAREVGDRRSLIKIFRAQAMLARKRREYDQALLHVEAAKRTAQELGDLLEAGSCRILQGDVERERLQMGRALAHYLEAREILQKVARSRASFEKDTASAWETIESRIQELAGEMGPEAYQRAERQRRPGGASGPLES
jgi:tetratricopeptide (TPR) repeat protein